MSDQLKRIAYLTNVYPAVSHSFIRREIRGLEAIGYAVARWSIRPCAPDLPDSDDQAEARQTRVILAGKMFMAVAAVLMLLTAPLRSMRALRIAMQHRSPGLRPLAVRLAYFAEACVVVRWSRAERIDHLHVHFGTNPTMVARLARKLGGPPYSFTAHGPDEFDNPVGLDLNGKVADAAFAVGISDFGRSQLCRWADYRDWDRIRIVRCGVDALFCAEGVDTPVPQTVDTPVLSCVARLAPQKGLPVLIDAAATLKAKGVAFRIEIAGDGPMRAEIAQRINALGLQEQVRLLGSLDAAGVADLLARSRGFVLPSFAEGLPVVIMEALALGRPVISTRIAGIGELVDEQCGWLIAPGNAAQLADAISALLDTPVATLTSMGRTGRQRVLDRHDAAKNAAELADLIAGNWAEHDNQGGVVAGLHPS